MAPNPKARGFEFCAEVVAGQLPPGLQMDSIASFSYRRGLCFCRCPGCRVCTTIPVPRVCSTIAGFAATGGPSDGSTAVFQILPLLKEGLAFLFASKSDLLVANEHARDSACKLGPLIA